MTGWTFRMLARSASKINACVSPMWESLLSMTPSAQSSNTVAPPSAPLTGEPILATIDAPREAVTDASTPKSTVMCAASRQSRTHTSAAARTDSVGVGARPRYVTPSEHATGSGGHAGGGGGGLGGGELGGQPGGGLGDGLRGGVAGGGLG
eukprot:scaffold291392_cov17-Tisochrysis_lutea.AAC.1